MMNARARLLATLAGKPVDRPPVSFYEVGGFTVDRNDMDPFNIYQDPTWGQLLDMAEQYTDLIKMKSPVRSQSHSSWGQSGSEAGRERDEFFHVDQWLQEGSRWTRTTVRVAGRELTSTTRRERDIDTVWVVEHLLKSRDDLVAYLQLPDEVFDETVDIDSLVEAEQDLGDRGLVMVDTEDPLCVAAGLFSMEDYTIIAMTEPQLFHQLLEKCARPLYARTALTSERFPGRLWRIYGPEYAAEPFMPPALFREYVVRYTQPMVDMIHQHGGYVRIHSHGRIRNVLDDMVLMGADAIDPIEAPPHGDIELKEVRQLYGDRLVLFGNIQATDIENMPTEQFADCVKRTLDEGTYAQGRGFVLMPTASPYGRKVSSLTLRNYETILQWAGCL